MLTICVSFNVNFSIYLIFKIILVSGTDGNGNLYTSLIPMAFNYNTIDSKGAYKISGSVCF